MCSLTDFIETSLGRCGGWVSTATVTGQGASLVDASVRGGDFSWPKAGTFRGHQRGHQLAHNRGLFHGHGHASALRQGAVVLQHPIPAGQDFVRHCNLQGGCTSDERWSHKNDSIRDAGPPQQLHRSIHGDGTDQFTEMEWIKFLGTRAGDGRAVIRLDPQPVHLNHNGTVNAPILYALPESCRRGTELLAPPL